MLPWKQRKHHILPVNQNLSSVYFSLAKPQLVSCNRSLAMIRQMTYSHKLPKLCAATLRMHILVWMLLQDISDRFGYRERYNARIYELYFPRFKVEYKRSYIFKALPVKQ